MKQKLIRLVLVLSTMALVAGCESDRLQRSDASPGIALPPVERDVKYGDDVLLATAAAQRCREKRPNRCSQDKIR